MAETQLNRRFSSIRGPGETAGSAILIQPIQRAGVSVVEDAEIPTVEDIGAVTAGADRLLQDMGIREMQHPVLLAADERAFESGYGDGMPHGLHAQSPETANIRLDKTRLDEDGHSLPYQNDDAMRLYAARAGVSQLMQLGGRV